MAIRRKKTKSAPASRRGGIARKPLAKAKISLANRSINEKLQIETYKRWEKQLSDAWDKMTQHLKKKNSKGIREGAHQLMILLGEGRYLQHELETSPFAKRKGSR